MTIFLYRASVPFACYAKNLTTTNNEVSKNAVFRKFSLKFVKFFFFLNIALFSCRRGYALLSGMQIIIPLLRIF